MSHKAEIFGKGFRPFDGGGFESVIVNGEEYTPEEIVAAMRAYKMKKFCDAVEQAKPERLESAAVGLESVGGETVKQARAGGLREEIQWALNGLPQLAVNLRYEEQTSRAETIERTVAILRRLAGGVTSLPESGQSIDDAYWQLIYAVASKYPNETRHETALRYILERESASSSGSTDAMVAALGAK